MTEHNPLDDLAPVPRTGNTLDLNAAERQRREGKGDALVVEWGDRVGDNAYRLPIEMPMEAIDQLAVMAEVEVPEGDELDAAAADALKQVNRGLNGGLAVMFCTCPVLPDKRVDKPASHEDQCQWPAFHRTRPSLETKMQLVQGVWAAYGVTMGEALAPVHQLQSTGRPSEPISNGTTGATRGTSTAGKTPQDRKPPAKRAAAKRAPAKTAAAKRVAKKRAAATE